MDVALAAGFELSGCVGSPPGGRLQAPYLGEDEILPELVRTGNGSVLVAVGDNATRKRLMEALIAMGFTAPVVVSGHAFVSPTATLGAGTVVLHGVVVGPYTRVGRGVILNTACTIDHDNNVYDFAHVAPGAHLAGDVRVGEGALVGIGSSALPRSEIGEWSIVGAGATVITAVKAKTIAVGTPAVEQGEAR
jgi:UDP-perosamine 4-acetyltransferase